LAYQNLIHLRRNKPINPNIINPKSPLCGLTKGLTGINSTIIHHNPSDKVIAYHRFDNGGAGDDVVVVVNISASEFPDYRIGLPRPGEWKVMFNSSEHKYQQGQKEEGPVKWVKLHTDTGHYDGYFWNGVVQLGKYSVVILAQEGVEGS